MATYLENFIDCLKCLPNDVKRQFALSQELDKTAGEIQYNVEQKYTDILECAAYKPIPVNPKQGDLKIPGHIVGVEYEELKKLRRDQFKTNSLLEEKIAGIEQSELMLQSFLKRIDRDLVMFRAELGDAAPSIPANLHNLVPPAIAFSVNPALVPSFVEPTAAGSSRRSGLSSATAALPSRNPLPAGQPTGTTPRAGFYRVATVTPSAPVLRTREERRPSATLSSSNHIIEGLVSDMHHFKSGLRHIQPNIQRPISGAIPIKVEQSPLTLAGKPLKASPGPLNPSPGLIKASPGPLKPVTLPPPVQLPHPVPLPHPAALPSSTGPRPLQSVVPILPAGTGASTTGLIQTGSSVGFRQIVAPPPLPGSVPSQLSAFPGRSVSTRSTRLGRTRGRGRVVNANVTPPFSSTQEDLFCTCQKPSYGEMVACDNPQCKVEWFHYSCVGLKQKPAGDWFCPACSKSLSQQSNGDLVPMVQS
eukprot:184771_1